MWLCNCVLCDCVLCNFVLYNCVLCNYKHHWNHVLALNLTSSCLEIWTLKMRFLMDHFYIDMARCGRCPGVTGNTLVNGMTAGRHVLWQHPWSVCLSGVSLWGGVWAHDRRANVVQQSLVICQRVVMWLLLLSSIVHRRFIFFVTQGATFFFHTCAYSSPLGFQISNLKHANPVSHPD